MPFNVAQDREHADRLAEQFRISDFSQGISLIPSTRFI